jgi:hypothetical protein
MHSAQARSMIERRATPRHTVSRAGTIKFGGGAIDCTIRNISPIGAALDVPNTSAIPHEITLLMVDGHLTQHCYVVWRNPSRVGVTFVRLNEPIIDPAPSGIRKPSLR